MINRVKIIDNRNLFTNLKKGDCFIRSISVGANVYMKIETIKDCYGYGEINAFCLDTGSPSLFRDTEIIYPVEPIMEVEIKKDLGTISKEKNNE